MPVYEYKCTKCENGFEVMQKITDSPLTKCSSCGGKLRKMITNTSFVLKGSGWYKTDYPSPDRKKAKEQKKPDSPNAGEKTCAENGPSKETAKS
ncbi:MAG: zinc ribbon domain-containing protein [Nitrospiraceae bacterium]|nr:MAG: zinc ribbon domain-containing protein [Nitrospiraceae bacterium]